MRTEMMAPVWLALMIGNAACTQRVLGGGSTEDASGTGGDAAMVTSGIGAADTTTMSGKGGADTTTTSGTGGADTTTTTTTSATTGTGGAGGGVPCGTLTWAVQKIGDPKWSIEDWQVYSGPAGTQQDGFAAALSTVLAVWPEHQYLPALNLIGPAAPHAPPYDTEVSTGVTAAGFKNCGTFPQAAWQGTRALFFSGVIVPAAGAPQGRTSDGDDLPMIPDDTPLYVDGNLYKNGALVDPAFGDGTYVGAFLATGDPSIEGYSHMPLNFFENTVFVAGSPGNYAFEAKVNEVGTGQGYTARLDFTIVP